MSDALSESLRNYLMRGRSPENQEVLKRTLSLCAIIIAIKRADQPVSVLRLSLGYRRKSHDRASGSPRSAPSIDFHEGCQENIRLAK